jgi:hypothetical protein
VDSALFPDADDVPEEHTLFVVDMKEYSKIPEAKMSSTRAEVDKIPFTVLAQCGMREIETLDDAVKDRGDGAIFVLPARHVARLVDPLLGHLGQALERRERSRPADAPSIRLRASVHVGPLEPPRHDGDAVNYACRLVDSDAARAAMAAAVDHELMLAAAVSGTAFDRSVRAGRTRTLQPRHFLSATALVKNKPGFQETCRLHVPGLVPTVIAPYLTADEDAAPTDANDPVARADPGRKQGGQETGGVRQKGKASGRARLIQVGRDYVTGPERE